MNIAVHYPYPDFETARSELARDPLAGRIPAEESEELLRRAWRTGVSAALAERRNLGAGFRVADAFRLHGVAVDWDEGPAVAAGRRVFGEYDATKRRVVLRRSALKEWAQARGVGFGDAVEAALAHEYFHFLECERLGSTARLRRVGLWRIGPFALFHSGVRALSEIGAHGFSHTYLRGNANTPLEDESSC